MNKSEIRDLHPRVKHLLSIANYSTVNEAPIKGGRIDFVAIQRETGNAMIVECKISIGNIWKTIGQINGYHKIFGLPNAAKWLASFQDVTDDQLDALIENDIEFRLVTDDTPLMGRSMANDVQEFIYWITHWGHEAAEGSAIEEWLRPALKPFQLKDSRDYVALPPNSFPPVPLDSPFRSRNPADWPQSPFKVSEIDEDQYRRLDDD